MNNSWQGHLALTFSHTAGATQLSRAQTRAPLKVQRPFYPEGMDLCHCVVLHTAGGMVGGDGLNLEIRLEPQAQALITTAAAGKVYGSRDRSHLHPGGRQTQQTIQIQMAADSYLEWLPQETIVFHGALYHQELQIELAPGACCCSWEITRLGRTAAGEAFLAGEWRSRTQIWRQNRPLWIDPQRLSGGSTQLQSPHALAGQPVVASLLWMGQPVSPTLLAEVRSLWSPDPDQGQVGVSLLPEGLLCRYRGPSSWVARTWLIRVWQLLRRSLRSRPPCLPRVWSMPQLRSSSCIC